MYTNLPIFGARGKNPVMQETQEAQEIETACRNMLY